ncbi:MAG: aromatic ring-hydroxylating dioxygenase subunit alpha [Hoeflea sp.]|uniref:aromatic ring-hydroxylating oxygenase subunit alpha n=1 Tax=Hoeflea sp. TaxID=1940281 RepID=UPI002730B1B8|nr:aromatic ring-hydroxylating dioxygenase subunit alpha [Hoeflea sp.]MDP2121178.1 aromatic ring-hydroxylating dioxygenase subunit alpha [Hoeflea sp.]
MNSPVSHRDISIPETWDRCGLPGWTYHSPAFLELEKQELFRKHWQIACHVSDLPEPGDYLAFDMCGERALLVRGQDGEVRAFHNMCRHRGARVVADEKGSCKGALVCPFHGWVYNLDGTLRGAARPKSFPELDKVEFGLQPLEAEIWNGFVFVRFEKGPQASVAELYKPFAEEIGHFDIAAMVPTGEPWTMVSKVNWKSVRDVDNEGYHVALAHPALQDLYGRSYFDEPFVGGVSRSYAECNANGRRWSVRNYLKTMQPRPGMPDYLGRAWLYYGLFPNAVIAATPESVQFYQEFPLSTGETLLRGAIYRYRDETRQQRLARKLAARIDHETMGEDVRLTEWSNEAMNSTAFRGFYLSDLEYGVRSHHDHLRTVLPVATRDERPPEDDIARLNAEMAASA